jgi:hypothetical protein
VKKKQVTDSVVWALLGGCMAAVSLGDLARSERWPAFLVRRRDNVAVGKPDLNRSTPAVRPSAAAVVVCRWCRRLRRHIAENGRLSEVCPSLGRFLPPSRHLRCLIDTRQNPEAGESPTAMAGYNNYLSTPSRGARSSLKWLAGRLVCVMSLSRSVLFTIHTVPACAMDLTSLGQKEQRNPPGA